MNIIDFFTVYFFILLEDVKLIFTLASAQNVSNHIIKLHSLKVINI